MAFRLRHTFRHYSTILSPNSSTPLTAKEKTRSALRLLKSETNPETIVEICRTASLSLKSHLDRIALSRAASKFSAGKNNSSPREYQYNFLRFSIFSKVKYNILTLSLTSHTFTIFTLLHVHGSPMCKLYYPIVLWKWGNMSYSFELSYFGRIWSTIQGWCLYRRTLKPYLEDKSRGWATI
jgi:hypothetical protein